MKPTTLQGSVVCLEYKEGRLDYKSLPPERKKRIGAILNIWVGFLLSLDQDSVDTVDGMGYSTRVEVIEDVHRE